MDVWNRRAIVTSVAGLRVQALDQLQAPNLGAIRPTGAKGRLGRHVVMEVSRLTRKLYDEARSVRHGRQAAANWVTFTPADSSYEIVTPGLPDGDTNGVFLRCKIHGHLGYADATVFDGVRRRTKIL